MQSRTVAALGLGVLAWGPLWTGCATQRDYELPSSSEITGASAGAESGGGNAGGAATNGGKPGSVAMAGTFGTAGTPPGNAGSAGSAATGGEPAAGGVPNEGGSGGAKGGCAVPADCDDDDPCTTDACQLQSCTHTANTAPCEDDGDTCTSDVCSMGTCTHPDNKTCACKTNPDCNDLNVCTDDTCQNHQCLHESNTVACADDANSCTDDKCAAGTCGHLKNASCECLKAADCDDADPCTFNQCSASGDCEYPNSGTCGVGVPFTVDSFNSSLDWLANKTSPDGRALVVAGFDLTNLEGNSNLYAAASVASSVEFALASLTGLGKLRIVIRSEQAGTGAMVQAGVWNGTAWTDKPLGDYAAIPMGGNYATIEVPLVDYGVALDQISKLRLRFVPTGGQKTWRVDEISVAK